MSQTGETQGSGDPAAKYTMGCTETVEQRGTIFSTGGANFVSSADIFYTVEAMPYVVQATSRGSD